MGKIRDYLELMRKIRKYIKHLRSLFVDIINKLHLGLSRKKAMIPKRVMFNRLQKTSVVGLFWRLVEK